jgi:hypothetical protein
MALIEVDGDELAKLQAELRTTKASHVLLDKLGKNPKTRVKVLRAMKEDNPDLIIPELDAAQPVLDDVAAIRAELAAEKELRAKDKADEVKRRQDESIEATISKSRAKLRKSGYDDEGIEGIEKLMQERGLTDYEAAEALFEKNIPQADPVMPADFGRTMPMIDESDADQKLLVRDKNSWRPWQHKKVTEVMKQLRNGQITPGF